MTKLSVDMEHLCNKAFYVCTHVIACQDSHLIKRLSNLTRQSQQKLSETSLTNSVDPYQTAPIGTVWFGSTLFGSILKLVNYYQQTTSPDDIFSYIFVGAFKVIFFNSFPYYIY